MTIEQLTIFSRYPEPGTTKTRLIPALGAERAAELQRQMTEFTLEQVRPLTQACGVAVEIRFAGGDRSRMQDWLGAQWSYEPQGEGDLGWRMQTAFAAAFARGCKRVVTIGIDCPGVDATRLAQAFHALRDHDLVLGPATDGGYYLIGLRRLVPELFHGIQWGTSEVFERTVELAQHQGLAIAILSPLTDIDRPEDLGIWEAAQQAQRQKISVIIPVLNEAETISQTLSRLRPGPDLDVIVVDGGSQDQTREKALSMGALAITSPPGRAHQMNAGAAIATGPLLLFLHADTQLPDAFADLVRHTLAHPRTVAGAFELRIDRDGPGIRWIERGVNWRSRRLGLPYGDQALFVTADIFSKLGGFPDLPIMEDFELVRRLRRLGRVAIAPASVLTSGRRWQRLGILRTTLLNQAIILGYLLGISPKRLAQWYRGGQGTKN